MTQPQGRFRGWGWAPSQVGGTRLHRDLEEIKNPDVGQPLRGGRPRQGVTGSETGVGRG